MPHVCATIRARHKGTRICMEIKMVLLTSQHRMRAPLTQGARHACAETLEIIVILTTYTLIQN